MGKFYVINEQTLRDFVVKVKKNRDSKTITAYTKDTESPEKRYSLIYICV